MRIDAVVHDVIMHMYEQCLGLDEGDEDAGDELRQDIFDAVSFQMKPVVLCEGLMWPGAMPFESNYPFEAHCLPEARRWTLGGRR